MKNNILEGAAHPAGLITLSLRWVIGWTYFSAFWRRLILENKLTPDEAGYIGEKFNHFLPNALGIKPLIEYLVTHPDALYIAMVAFTLVEAVVGLFLLLGLFTRLMSIGVFLLALGILLGSGWLGTTCLDEWQIGVLGIAGGLTLFLSGSSAYSLDHYLIRKKIPFTTRKWFHYLGTGNLPAKHLQPVVVTLSVLLFGLTLYTNQYFHGGVYGPLHNKSVKPKVEITNLKTSPNSLTFQLYRTEGADVYGSFLIGIEILNSKKETVQTINQEALSKFPATQIQNHYIAKIKPGKHSLILPLGAKANITIPLNQKLEKEAHTLKLTDISGITWTAKIPRD